MGKSLLIVESPAKAKTIGKYLGQDFEVRASVGHIIDLPKSSLGVDIQNGFSPEYVVIDGKQKVIDDLKKAAKGKDVIYLGPDPDREGEAIAWHIARALGEKHNYKRVLLHELTPRAIREAIDHPVAISKTRFESQQARRILDRLMGYLISPLLWDKLKRGLSAGRVQSVALRLIVERERAIFAFNPEEYWSLTAEFLTDGKPFSAQLSKIGGAKAALTCQEEALTVVRAVTGREFTVEELVTKERKRYPLPPFTTSTLQQAAFNRLKMASKRAMRVAQDLYEGVSVAGEGQVGLITYMRTDSVRVNAQAAGEALEHIRKNFGPDYAPAAPNHYKNKKGAQDAHEAVRPTSISRDPALLKGQLETAHWQLYDLIWRRFVASQMTPAVLEQTTADLKNGDYVFRASGSVIKFKGFLSLYEFGKDEEKELLPPLAAGQKLQAEKITPKQHFTQPPPRFNEATLVKELEENGIGRPSTYAAIISTLKDKEYVDSAKGSLKPTEMGFAVTDLLVKNFPDIMDVDFTAGLEENLDEIEEGKAEHLDVLARLYNPLAGSLENAKAAMANLKRDGLPAGVDCPACGVGAALSLRYGRNGFYLACRECGSTCDFERDEHGVPRPTPPSLEAVDKCEKCGRPMVIKKSRYGPFAACTGYPECKNAKPLVSSAAGEVTVENPPELPADYPKKCEKCGSDLVVKKNRQGSWFVSCTAYPKCKNAKPFPSGIKCHKEGCDGEIVERSSKRGSFYGCSNYPKCRTLLKSKPVPAPCPVCGRPYLIENPKAKNDPAAPPLICTAKGCPGPAGTDSA
ncbi:MAG: type I DNA topoisomerase [Candidatus Adiutrix sp.]|jgi:DNA topoisomerase-1|nr:type I DNA topoisomerase [Candidatus Adiutrix sp.]